jgi:hypothetical protein
MRLGAKIFFFSVVVFLFCFLTSFASQPNFGGDAKRIKEKEKELLRETRFGLNPYFQSEWFRSTVETSPEKFRKVLFPYAEPFDLERNRPVRPGGIPRQHSSDVPLTIAGQRVIQSIIDDFLVNDDTIGGANQQEFPAIARAPSGNFVITWVDRRPGYSAIYAQLYDPTGTPKRSNFKVSDYSTYSSSPVVAMNSSGSFVIVWTDIYSISNADIYAQRYDSAGTASGSNFKINDDAGTANPCYPAVAMDDTGKFVITWQDYRNFYTCPDIYAQRYDAFGSPLGLNLKVNEDRHQNQYAPAIAVDGAGNFLITWIEVSNYYYWIYARRYSSSGTPLDSNFAVGYGIGHATAMDASGNFVIATHWGSSIHAQRYDSTGTPLDTVVQVNDDTISVNSYSNCDVALDRSGNFVITWEGDNPTRGVMAQRYNSSGSPLGANFRVNNIIHCNDLCPAVASDADGNFVVTWEDYRNGHACRGSSGADVDIYAQMYNSAGDSLGSNFRVVDDGGVVDQMYPDIAADRFGNFTIIWQGIGNAQRFDSSGNALGNNFRVISDAFKAIAMDDSGNFVVTVSSNLSYGNVYAQRYNYLGVPLDSVFKVNDTTVIYQVLSDVAMDRSGNFVIVWRDGRHSEGSPDIYAQRYDVLGSPLGSNFMVNDRTVNYYRNVPSIAMDQVGEFVITWGDARGDIYAQRYDSLGNALDSNFKVTDDASVKPWFPAIAMNISGSFVITWRDARDGSWDVYVQRYDLSGTPLGTNLKVNDDVGTAIEYDLAYKPAVAMDSSGNFIIAWHDERNGNPDVYAQRYNSSGNPLGSNYLVPNPQYASFDQLAPAVATHGSNIYFAWQDNRRAKGWDIYAKVVDWNWTKVGEEQNAGLPKSFELAQNYPNPFNPSTIIEYALPRDARARIDVYNILGQKVKTLVDEYQVAGHKRVTWDGKNDSGQEISTGIYFYRIDTGDFVQAKKMVCLK